MKNPPGPTAPAVVTEPLKILTRDQAEASMGILAALTIELNGAVALQSAKIVAARQHDEEIGNLKKRMERYELALREWAEQERGNWPEKSLALRQGVIGFRKSPPKLVNLDGVEDAGVLERIRKMGNAFRAAFIRVKEEVNRKNILANAAASYAGPHKLEAAQLKKMGVRLEQSENFYAEPALVVA